MEKCLTPKILTGSVLQMRVGLIRYRHLLAMPLIPGDTVVEKCYIGWVKTMDSNF